MPASVAPDVSASRIFTLFAATAAGVNVDKTLSLIDIRYRCYPKAFIRFLDQAVLDISDQYHKMYNKYPEGYPDMYKTRFPVLDLPNVSVWMRKYIEKEQAAEA